jgi:co-chaperonin GroES (HSP10)
MIQAMPGKVVLKRIKQENTKNLIYMTETTYLYQIVSVLDNQQGLKANDFVVVDDAKLLKSSINNEEYYMCKIEDIYACIM